MYSIEYGTTNISFNVIRKSNLKNTYICVNSEGVVVKTNRSTTIENINQMVQKKSSWISKKMEMFKTKPTKTKITTGSRLYYMGKSYYVNINKDKNIQTIEINFTHSKFYIITPIIYEEIKLNHTIEKFYKEKAIQKITPIIKKYSKIMGVEPKSVGFRYAKTKWGSCNSNNQLSFNYQLIKLPSSLIEYVVIHELAHIIHKNHSQEFWKEVYKYLPNYKTIKERIREFERVI